MCVSLKSQNFCESLVEILTEDEQYEYPQNGKKNLQFISRESSYTTWILWQLSISNSTCYCNYCNPSGQSAQLCHSWLILGGAEPLLFLRWRNYTNYMSQHAEIHIVTILPVTGWLVLYFSIMQFSSLAVKQIFLNLFRVN